MQTAKSGLQVTTHASNASPAIIEQVTNYRVAQKISTAITLSSQVSRADVTCWGRLFEVRVCEQCDGQLFDRYKDDDDDELMMMNIPRYYLSSYAISI